MPTTRACHRSRKHARRIMATTAPRQYSHLFVTLFLATAARLPACQGFTSHQYPPRIGYCLRLGAPRIISRRRRLDLKIETDGWEAGDVDRDLDNLERAIRLANADSLLKQQERMDRLDYLAESRRPLFPDLRKFVLFPLVFAGLFRKFSSTAPVRIFKRISDIQFFCLVVAAPISLLIAKRLTRNPEPMPDDLSKLGFQSLDPEYLDTLSVTVDWEPPDVSCRDSVLVLLEYWTSAVSSAALIGLWKLLSKGKFASAWSDVAQLVARIAAVAALYQNPEQVYLIRREKQPRPFAFFTTVTRSLISWMISLLPFGLAVDLTVLLARFSDEAVGALFSSILILSVGTWVRMANEQREQDGFAHLERLSVQKRWLYGLASLTSWRRPLKHWLRERKICLETIRNLGQLSAVDIFPQIWTALGHFALWLSSGAVALTIPILHLRSAAKLLRIVFTHNVSLALDTATFQAAVADESRLKWRYRWEWQEKTQRVGKVFQAYRENFVYWLFVEGRVLDKIRQESKEKIENAYYKKWNLKDRIFKDIQQGKKFTRRDDLQKLAMQRVADKHQDDYDRQDFEDPLGVALQQTLGIGLSFNFNHSSPLARGEKPSIRRLQARAAKSAIRRVQELYDAKSAVNNLAKLSDPNERNKAKEDMRKEAETEIQEIAKRMTQLIPPPSGFSGSNDFKDKQLVRRFTQIEPKQWVKVNSHEYRQIAEDPVEAVESIEQDILNFGSAGGREADHKTHADHATGTPPSSDDEPTTLDNPKSTAKDEGTVVEDGEFIQAYIEQQKRKLSTSGDNDGDIDFTLA